MMVTIVSCNHNPASTTPSTPPPPGAVNQFDATVYRVLSDAQAAIESIKSDQQSGKITLSAQEKSIFNQLIQHYNAAESLAQAYHAAAQTGNPDTATLTTAINQVISDIAAVTQQIQGASKAAAAKSGGVK
jgi:hypothetical protein